MDIIGKVFRKLKYQGVILAITSLLSGFGHALFIGVITYCINDLKSNTSTRVLVFTGTCLGILVLRQTHQYIVLRITHEVANTIRLELSNCVLLKNLREVEKFGSSGILTTLLEDVGTLCDFIMSLPSVLTNSSMVIGAIIYLGYLSAEMLLVFILFITIGGVVYSNILSSLNRIYTECRRKVQSRIGLLEDLSRGVKELKMDTHKSHDFLVNCLTPTQETITRLDIKATWRHYFALNLGQACFYIFIGLTIFSSTYFFGTSEEIVLAYVFAIVYITIPLQSLFDVYPKFATAKVSRARIADLESALEPQDESRTTNFSETNKSELRSFDKLSLQSVTFGYHAENTIGPLDFEINKGETIFLVGGNGSGKNHVYQNSVRAI